MTANTTMSVEDAFFMYMEDRTVLPPTVIAECLKKASDYCRLKQTLLGMTDVNEVRKVQLKVAEENLLRFRYGKDAQNVRNITQLYYTFIKGYREEKPQPVIKSMLTSEKPIIELASPEEEDTQENHVFNKKGLMTSEISDVDSSVSATSHMTTIDTPSPEKLWVDFSYDNSYLFTKPISYTYKGVVCAAKSWNELYVEVCGHLFGDYREMFMGIMNGNIPGYNALSFADVQHKSGMRVAGCFAPGFYLESNADATTIVRQIRGLYCLFGLDDKLKILYQKTGNINSVVPKKVPAEEWILVQLKDGNFEYQDKRAWDDCLWIVGGHELDSFAEECKAKGYLLFFKKDGCKTYPNRPVWWTKDSIMQQNNTSSFRRRLDRGFKTYLIAVKRLTNKTTTQYSLSVAAVERFIQDNGLGFTLDTADPDDAQFILDLLEKQEDFIAWNNQRNHQYSAALAEYVDYLRCDESDADALDTNNRMTIKEAIVKVLREAGEPLNISEIMRVIEAQQLYRFNSNNPTLMLYQCIRQYCKSMKAPHHLAVDVFDRFTDENGQFRYVLIDDNKHNNNVSPILDTPADDRWQSILQDSFTDGYILHDFLCRFQASGLWQERYGEVCPIEGDDIDRAMKAVGTVRDARVFTKSEKYKQLLSAICVEIDDILSHYTAVYRTCIYDHFQAQLSTCQIYTERVMTQLLSAETNGGFYAVYQFFARHGQDASVVLDCRQVLRNHGGAMAVSEVATELWFIPYDIVYHYLSADDEALNIGNSVWMLAEHFQLTREDSTKVGDMLDEYFLSQDYIQAVNLMPLMERLLPSIADNLSGMHFTAVFNILNYYLKERFSFSRATISPKGAKTDIRDLFRGFAKEHERFSLDELAAFSSELQLSIYWESTFLGGAVRVSRTEFIHRSLISFDVEATDTVLESFCTGDYLPIQAVSSAMMMHLPPCGYCWNGYLLLTYVYSFSKTFRLIYNSLGKTGHYGAIVRRSCKQCDSYKWLVEQVLTDDDSWQTEDDALSVLVNKGLQAQKRLKGIEQIVAKALQRKLLMGGELFAQV